MRTCTNPACLTEFAPNVNGAIKDLCARCYKYAHRHEGLLPGPIAQPEPTRAITIRIPLGFEERIRQVSELPLATWVRMAAELRLSQLERIERESIERKGKA